MTQGVWVLAAAALVVAPLAMSLARSARFEASLEAFPFQRTGYRPIGDPTEYARRLLADPLVPVEAVRLSRLPLDPRDVRGRVRLERTPRSVLVRAEADSPTHARNLADAVALALVNASARDIGEQARAQLRGTRGRLVFATGPERRRLERSAGRLLRTVETPPAAMVLGPRSTPPEPTRAVDRVVGWLPGPHPPRPSVAWTILAGLLFAALVSLAAYGYSEARRTVAEG